MNGKPPARLLPPNLDNSHRSLALTSLPNNLSNLHFFSFCNEFSAAFGSLFFCWENGFFDDLNVGGWGEIHSDIPQWSLKDQSALFFPKCQLFLPGQSRVVLSSTTSTTCMHQKMNRLFFKWQGCLLPNLHWLSLVLILLSCLTYRSWKKLEFEFHTNIMISSTPTTSRN